MFGEIQAAEAPVIIRGLVDRWPLVENGKSLQTLLGYLSGFAGPHPLTLFSGGPEMRGKFFYNQDMTGFNFHTAQISPADFFDLIRTLPNDEVVDHHYVGSTDLDRFFPGLRDENDLIAQTGILPEQSPIVSIWMGNRTTAAAHFDMSNNIACCLVGRRRFTLFPPDQIANLYPGPLEPTPAGQSVSLVDFENPDFSAHPGFEQALKAAQVAELEPGDVLYYPALWWHQVEALDLFNVMINYWWNEAPAFMDTPMLTLMHGMLSLRDRPDQERNAWRALFDYYLFDGADTPKAHLPEHARGVLDELSPDQARRLRAVLLKRLNR